jgi:1-deoxy-D-xylulose-5-phosphate synthase
MLVHMLHTALEHEGPIGIRYPRGEGEGVALPAEPEVIELGRGEVLREGERVALVGYGLGVALAVGAAGMLEDDGFSPTVVDARFAKPLDEQLLKKLARSHELIVTVEDNVLMGGFGSAVLESLADRDLLRETRVVRFGIPDAYVTHGKPNLLREEIGLTPEAIAERVVQEIGAESLA